MKIKTLFYLFVVFVYGSIINADFGQFKTDINYLKQNALTYVDTREMLADAMQSDIQTFQEALNLLANGEPLLPRHECHKRNGSVLSPAKIEKRIAYLQDALLAFEA
ncbi:hypothetical protein FJ366_04190 [Candidatus Dependentiae bacterium]|nr:hypothetical protein [Candidatus Dependentiae bacterium]